MKTVNGKNFSTITKVDTHIHHSAAMTCLDLLNFIKNKLEVSNIQFNILLNIQSFIN